jgi:hypothetical protein
VSTSARSTVPVFGDVELTGWLAHSTEDQDRGHGGPGDLLAAARQQAPAHLVQAEGAPERPAEPDVAEGPAALQPHAIEPHPHGLRGGLGEGVKSSVCSPSPVIARASALARARPSASSSPRWETVCWTTVRPMRTERTSRRYVWPLPSFPRVVWRKYISLAYAAHARTKSITWSALHARFRYIHTPPRTLARHATPELAGVARSTAEELG